VKIQQTQKSVFAVVNRRVCELAIELQLLVVTIYKSSVNLNTNSNHVTNHSYTCQYNNSDNGFNGNVEVRDLAEGCVWV
jgi:hypothetical protein